MAEAQNKVVSLETQVAHLQAQWTVMQDRLIVVLKLAGRCTVRSIVEVLESGLGIHVSVGYVQGVITQAELSAHTALGRLLEVITLSGAICVDEVFFKEVGRQMLGVVIVDPLSGLILRLQRCSERSKEAIGEVLQQFAAAGFQERIKLYLTDMYTGYLQPVKTHLPKAVHQFCWFHINCFHIGARVHRATRTYEKAVKALAVFDKQHPNALSPADQKQRQALVAAQDQAQRYWARRTTFPAHADGYPVVAHPRLGHGPAGPAHSRCGPGQEPVRQRDGRLPGGPPSWLVGVLRLPGEQSAYTETDIAFATKVGAFDQALGGPHHFQCSRTCVSLPPPLHPPDGPLWHSRSDATLL